MFFVGIELITDCLSIFTSPVAKYRPSGEIANEVIAFRAVLIMKSCFCVWISYKTTVELERNSIISLLFFLHSIKKKIIPSCISYCWTILTNKWIWNWCKTKNMFKINLKLKKKLSIHITSYIYIYLNVISILEIYSMHTSDRCALRLSAEYDVIFPRSASLSTTICMRVEMRNDCDVCVQIRQYCQL